MKTDRETTLLDIKKRYKDFCDARNWKNYNIRDILLSIMIELGELSEHFQWDGMIGENSVKNKDISAIKQEFADVFNYILRLAIELEIDITSEVEKKLNHHETKYPVGKHNNNVKKVIKDYYKNRSK